MSSNGPKLASDDMKKVMVLHPRERIRPVFLYLFEMNKLKPAKKGFHCGSREVAFGPDLRPLVAIAENLSRKQSSTIQNARQSLPHPREHRRRTEG